MDLLPGWSRRYDAVADVVTLCSPSGLGLRIDAPDLGAMPQAALVVVAEALVRAEARGMRGEVVVTVTRDGDGFEAVVVPVTAWRGR